MNFRHLLWLSLGAISGCSAFGERVPLPVLSEVEQRVLEERIQPVESKFPSDPYFFDVERFISEGNKFRDSPAMLDHLKKHSSRLFEIISLHSGRRFSLDDYGFSDGLSFLDVPLFGKGKRHFMQSKVNSICNLDGLLNVAALELDPFTKSDLYESHKPHRVRADVVAKLFNFMMFDGIARDYNFEVGMYWIEDFIAGLEDSRSSLKDDDFFKFLRTSAYDIPNQNVLVAYLLSRFSPKDAWSSVVGLNERQFFALFDKRNYASMCDAGVSSLKARYGDSLSKYDSMTYDKFLACFLENSDSLKSFFEKSDFSGCSFDLVDVVFNGKNLKVNYGANKLSYVFSCCYNPRASAGIVNRSGEKSLSHKPRFNSIGSLFELNFKPSVTHKEAFDYFFPFVEEFFVSVVNKYGSGVFVDKLKFDDVEVSYFGSRDCGSFVVKAPFEFGVDLRPGFARVSFAGHSGLSGKIYDAICSNH